MKQIVPLASFERSFKKLDHVSRQKAAIALEKFSGFLQTGTLPAGLGFKKINHNKPGFCNTKSAPKGSAD